MVGSSGLGPFEGAPSNGEPAITTHRLSELVTGRPPPDGYAQRAGRHVIMLFTAGAGQHCVDFQAYPCRPGTLLWGRPGQVHVFGAQAGLDATLVTFRSDACPEASLDGLVTGPLAPAYWQLAGEDEDAIVSEVTQLDADCARYVDDGENSAADLLRQELVVLLMRIRTMSPPAPAGAATTLLSRLYDEVEASIRHAPIAEYAERLGCSVRTLTRACLTTTGRSAKQLIDQRLALEAKRLLATTDLPAAEVGRLLGFGEPTNFGRFFLRETGRAPGAFRGDLALVVRPSPAAAPRSSLPGRLTAPPLR
jgi:AraC-like DNA-binding protein